MWLSEVDAIWLLRDQGGIWAKLTKSHRPIIPMPDHQGRGFLFRISNSSPVCWWEKWRRVILAILPKNKEWIRVHFRMQVKVKLPFSLMAHKPWTRRDFKACLWFGRNSQRCRHFCKDFFLASNQNGVSLLLLMFFFLLCSAYWLTSAVMLSRCSYVNERALFVFRHPRCCAPKWAAWLRIL